MTFLPPSFSARRGRAALAALIGIAAAGSWTAPLAAGEDCGKSAEVKASEVKGSEVKASEVKALEAKPGDAKASDYPTTAVADYVFGCMAANGESRQALFNCSCSFDVMASILPYSKYEQAETIISVGQQGGQGTEILRTNPQLKEIVAEMRRAQAEAEVRCF